MFLVRRSCLFAGHTRAGLISLQQRKGRAGRNLDGIWMAHTSAFSARLNWAHFRWKKCQTSREWISVDCKCPPIAIVTHRDFQAYILSSIMTMLSLQLGTPLQAIFDALPEPPNPTRLSLFLTNLHANGLLDAHHQLTAAGCVVAHLPVEPSIGKLCIYGLTYRCLGESG